MSRPEMVAPSQGALSNKGQSNVRFKVPPTRLSDNSLNASCCHSEPFGRLRINSAKNLIDSDTYAFEILRLTPQNDVVGQPLKGDLCLSWSFLKPMQILSIDKQS
jgi:hypothetical protein